MGTILFFTGTAAAAPPGPPTITEPATDGQLVHPADVHMEAGGFTDNGDTDTHKCTNWEIRTAGDSPQVVWHALCATGIDAVHIHLGDGSFVAPFTHLNFDSNYVLRAQFQDSADETSDWSLRPFGTYPPSSPGGAIPWTAAQPGYVIDQVAGGFQLPLNIAFVPNPGSAPGDPLLYVTELYGRIKVITRDGSVSNYATGLLNFNPTGDFPGSGEQGLTGIAVEPGSGDVYASLLYDAAGAHHPKVIKFQSVDGGRTGGPPTTVLDMPLETQGQSHQISNLSFGPDGKLYVHMGDGFDYTKAQDLTSFRGKVLRVNPDGSAPSDNPFYDGGPPYTARDYVFARGFRNPFGGAWRASTGEHYEVENGPAVDRLARIDSGVNYLWDNTNASMLNGALYNWDPSHAPVNIAFVQDQSFDGSGFPDSQVDHAFVTESGPTWATGPQLKGKRIVEFDPDPDNGDEIGGHPRDLVEYTGTGKATAAGLAAGPDGLYFTDLYKDLNYTSAIDPGARLLRIRYGPPLTPRLFFTSPASPADENSPRVIGSAATIGSTVRLYTDAACSRLAATGSADQLASSGIQVSVPDSSSTAFYATATVAGVTSGCSRAGLTYVEQSPAPPAGVPGEVASGGFDPKAAKRRCKKKFRGKARHRCIRRVKEKAAAL